MKFNYTTNNIWIMLVIMLLWLGLTGWLLFLAIHTNWRAAATGAAALAMLNAIKVNGKRLLD